MSQRRLCPCGSQQAFNDCCEPFIIGKKRPATPEQLMRSRYSAYASSAYQYIVDTYAKQPRSEINVAAVTKHDESSHWKRLEVLQAEDNTVSFKAFYMADGQYYCMHEVSQFVQEDKQWRYLNGKMQDSTGKLDIGRNTPCPCDSGKKFKRCCARQD